MPCSIPKLQGSHHLILPCDHVRKNKEVQCFNHRPTKGALTLKSLHSPNLVSKAGLKSGCPTATL